ncbi:C6 transcription factor [Colletotrichum sojae]|uniref:C6 transcription factor n=1 Tax=Colletotrichum sojae TaxID=2175907 RepID=A0A8H6MU62_9PEZI|nr:C6 transcription factor [Colletotrichum sojae]
MAGHHHSYREIRPAFSLDSSPPGGDPAPDDFTGLRSSAPGRKGTSRRNVLVACASCKKRKIKCSAERPKCSGCVSKNLACQYDAGPCESRSAMRKRKYEESERQNDCLKEFFDALRSMPEAHSYDVVRRIRAGASAEEVLRLVKAGNVLLQLSSQGSDMSDVAAGMPTPERTPEMLDVNPGGAQASEETTKRKRSA